MRHFKIEFMVHLRDTEETGIYDDQVVDTIFEAVDIARDALRTRLKEGRVVKGSRQAKCQNPSDRHLVDVYIDPANIHLLEGTE